VYLESKVKFNLKSENKEEHIVFTKKETWNSFEIECHVDMNCVHIEDGIKFLEGALLYI
jgi:hypothetical protein